MRFSRESGLSGPAGFPAVRFRRHSPCPQRSNSPDRKRFVTDGAVSTFVSYPGKRSFSAGSPEPRTRENNDDSKRVLRVPLTSLTNGTCRFSQSHPFHSARSADTRARRSGVNGDGFRLRRKRLTVRWFCSTVGNVRRLASAGRPSERVQTLGRFVALAIRPEYAGFRVQTAT